MKKLRKSLIMIFASTLFFMLPTLISAEDVNPRGDFVGSEACYACHKDVAEKYETSHHKNVMRKLYTEENNSISAPWGTEEAPKVVTTTNRKFTLYMKGDKYRVTIHDTKGATQDFQIDAVAFTVQTLFFSWDAKNEHLITLPFNYWNNSTKQERWGNGMDVFWFEADGSFATPEKWAKFGNFYNWDNRCAECHMTGFNVSSWKEVPFMGRVADKTNIWTEQTEWKIGCEKCHGPGAKHAKTGKLSDIINPEKLQSATGSQECDQCHQSGHAKNYQSGFWSELPMIFDEGSPLGQAKHYTVGDNLDDFYVENKRRLWHGTDYLKEGKAYTDQVRSSKHGQAGMNCKTCHDPHSEQTRLPANDLCVSCHADKAGKEGRMEHLGKSHFQESVNCIDCHMPMATISYLRSQRYDGRWHIWKPVTPNESLAQFDYLKEFTKPDADPKSKLTKDWKKIQQDPEGCYDSYYYSKNVHFCATFDILPNACSSCHKEIVPKMGNFDDENRNRLVKGKKLFERLMDERKEFTEKKEANSKN